MRALKRYKEALEAVLADLRTRDQAGNPFALRDAGLRATICDALKPKGREDRTIGRFGPEYESGKG